jgi:hypothetical protein
MADKNQHGGQESVNMVDKNQHGGQDKTLGPSRNAEEKGLEYAGTA